MFIMIHEKNYLLPCLLPLLQLLDKIFSEQDKWAGKVLLPCNQFLPLLLIIGTWVDVLFLHGLYAVMILVLCLFVPPMRIQPHLPSPASSRSTFLMYPVHSPKQIMPVPHSCTCPVCLSLCTLCSEMAVHAISRWDICVRLFLLTLWQKLIQCLQYVRQSMSRSYLMSSAFAIFLLPLDPVVKAIAIFAHDPKYSWLFSIGCPAMYL